MKFHWKQILITCITALLLTVPAMAGEVITIDVPAPSPVSETTELPELMGPPLFYKYVRPDPVGPNWIDRVHLEPDLMAAYAALEEATDNDGIKDYLIEDKYYQPGNGIPSTVNQPGDIRCRMWEGQFLTEMLLWNDTQFPSTDQDYQDCIQTQIILMLTAFFRDHPEVFWLSGEIDWTWEYSSSYYRVYLTLNQRVRSIKDESTIKALIQQRDSDVQKILDAGQFTEQTTDLKKVCHFNDWLTHHNQYQTWDLKKPEAHLCLPALKGSVGSDGPVCEGYSKAFKVLCDSQGIPCVLVDGANHMWNNVRVNGTWYAMDVTWNDPIGGRGGAVSGGEQECYSLVGSKSKIGYSRSSADEFQSKHPVRNEMYPGYAGAFNKGPEVSETACYALHTPVNSSVSEPSCETAGMQYRDCSHCGCIYFDSVLPALGHDWQWVENQSGNGYHAQCRRNPEHIEDTLSFLSIRVFKGETEYHDVLPAENGLSIRVDLMGAYTQVPIHVVAAFYGHDGRMLYAESIPIDFNFGNPAALDNASGAVADIRCFAMTPGSNGMPLTKSIQFSAQQEKVPEAPASGTFLMFRYLLPAFQSAW